MTKTCVLCNYTFNRKSNYNRHMQNSPCSRQMNNTITEIKCNFCKTKFINQKNLQNHFSCCKVRFDHLLKEKDEKHANEIKKISENYEMKIKKSSEKHVETCNEIHQKYQIQIKEEIKNHHLELTKLHQEINDLNLKLNKKHNDLQMQIKPLKENFELTLIDGEKIKISIREDGYINATELCRAGNKHFSDWNENKKSQEYLQVLGTITGIPVLKLVESKQGQGTWVHRKVAINIAQWISAHFSVQVSNVMDELLLTGKVELGKQLSSTELDNIYNEKRFKEMETKLKFYEPNIFTSDIDFCPINYYGKDVIYFLKFDLPLEYYSKYISSNPKLNNNNYRCIEFGVSSDLEKRLLSHKRDGKKDKVVFLHAIEIKNRFSAAKIEFYVKTLAKQMNIKFNYEKNKECFIANENEFNLILNKIKHGIQHGINELPNDILMNQEDDDNNDDIDDNRFVIEDDDVDIRTYENTPKNTNDDKIKIKKMDCIIEILKHEIKNKDNILLNLMNI